MDNLPLPGDHTGKVTPVPIPNTAVKLARADDSLTAKVGRCLDFFSEPSASYNTRAVFFTLVATGANCGSASGLALRLGLWPYASRTSWDVCVERAALAQWPQAKP